MIPVDHEGTRRAEQYREDAKPVPTPREPEPPAAWEATPEPTLPPAQLQMRSGRGRGVRVVVPSAPEGGATLNADNVRVIQSMFRQARQVTNDPQTRARLRAAEAELNAKTRGAL
ncbi:hypothetical protein [Microbacterium azadirachtae]|nr:hypothetical protein [Microbacterium azadirachtae]